MNLSLEKGEVKVPFKCFYLFLKTQIFFLIDYTLIFSKLSLLCLLH